jgi:hypothetical protein
LRPPLARHRRDKAVTPARNVGDNALPRAAGGRIRALHGDRRAVGTRLRPSGDRPRRSDHRDRSRHGREAALHHGPVWTDGIACRPSARDRRGSVLPACGTGNNGQAVDLAQFTSLGINPTRYRTVAVKSMQHFRAAFEPIARQVGLSLSALYPTTHAPHIRASASNCPKRIEHLDPNGGRGAD